MAEYIQRQQIFKQRVFVLLAIIFIGLVHTVSSVTPEAAQDEVTDLAYLYFNVSFKHYSGYFNTSNGNMLHYWFFESTSNPRTDPVMLWLNGGPGCSSLHGLLAEHGPFYIKKDLTVGLREYSWNRLANMLYLESPAGVGYSYNANGQYNNLNDDETAKTNYIAIQQFFKRFPNFKSNDFYISGESYAAVYVPTLAMQLMNDPSIKLKGLAIGNGINDFSMNFNSWVYYMYYRGFYSTKLYTQLRKACCHGDICNFYGATSGSSCNKIYTSFLIAMARTGLNRYDLYHDCVYKSIKYAKESHDKLTLTQVALNKLFYKSFYTPPCYDDYEEDTYCQLEEVRKSLHIHSNALNWTLCRRFIQTSYRIQYMSIYLQFRTLLQKYRILLFYGESDSVCNYIGGEWVIKKLALPQLTPYNPWYVTTQNGKQIGGFMATYPNLRYVTIKGAGHLAPENKPLETFTMLKDWMQASPTTANVLIPTLSSYTVAIVLIVVALVIETLF